MFPFGRFFDHLVATVVDRLVSIVLPAAGDKRRRLARELVALDRELLVAAELCRTVIDRLRDERPLSGFEDDEWLMTVDTSAARVSDGMLQTIRRLKGAFEVMDPPLARALEVLYESKFSLLMIASSSVDFDGQRLCIWDASEALCNLRLKNLLRRLEGPDILEHVQWPYGAVVGGLGKDESMFDEYLIDVVDGSGDSRRAELAARLELHYAALLHAREKLGAYLREKFDLSDIL